MSAVRTLTAAAAVIALQLGPVAAQTMRTPPPFPLSRLRFEQLKLQPALLRLHTHPLPVVIGPFPQRPASSPWQPVASPPFSPGAMLLMTDGTVMVQDAAIPTDGSGSAWWRLAPDALGNYANGHWTQIASMQAGYCPLYFASAVLPDGRVIVEGGEYNGGEAVWTGQGSIYNPTTNAWTPVAPPAGMDPFANSIGDAQGVVLANGSFMLSPVYAPVSGDQQILSAAKLTWTATGKGKTSANDEEGQALLSSGKVLTVDVAPTVALSSKRFDPSTGAWTGAGSTIVQVWDGNNEVGPMPVLPTGDVLAVGATLGHNAVYHGNAWLAGPDFPVIGGAQFGTADGPAATLPSGKVLVLASAGYGVTPAHFFIFDGKAMTAAADTPNCPSMTSYFGYMIVLPTGQVMFNDRIGGLELYTDAGKPSPLWAPRVTSLPTQLRVGRTYQVAGNQLSGRSTGASYGDDYQSATNYPLARITNDVTHHVFYARTSRFSTTSIQANVPATATFNVLPGTETGKAHFVLVANGIPSAATAITISP